MTLSVVVVTYNSSDVVEGALQSIEGFWDELLVGDGGSTDGTVGMVKKYGAKIIRQIRPQHQPFLLARLTAVPHKGGGAGQANKPRTKNLGERKQELVEKAKGDWILVLDTDERVSEELKDEITLITHPPRRSHRLTSFSLPPSEVGKNAAYRIPYQNYVFGKPVYYGGERYAKVRLFRQGYARISPDPLHEEVVVTKGTVGELKGVIHHHSYRTPIQLIKKFTLYAWMAAGILIQKQRLGSQRAKPSLEDTMKKLFLYGPHMFWARYIKEKGYKDGWRGLILALAFGYMEGLTYWFQLLRNFTR